MVINEVPHQERKASRESLKNIIAGAMGAMIARAVCQPLDVTKVRLQVYPKRYKSMGHALSTIYKEEGFRAMWQGHCLAQTSGFTQGAVQFFLYEQLSYSLRKTSLEAVPNLKNFVCGFLTGTLGLIVIAPIEMLKTRSIAQDKKNRQGMLKIANKVFLAEGIRGIYRGAFTAAIQVGPLLGSRFMVYNFLCDIAMNFHDVEHKSQLPAMVLLLAGGGSGVVSNAVTYPVDMVKRRIQVHGGGDGMSSCDKIIQCIVKTVREDGYRGFFKGISPSILKSFITTSLTFSAFDKIKATLNYLDGTGWD